MCSRGLASTIATLTVFACLSCVAFSLNGDANKTVHNGCKEVQECLKRLDQGKECSTLPVPESSLVPLFGSEQSVQVVRLRAGVWVYRDGGYNSMILRAGKGLAMIDFPDTIFSNKPDGGTRITDAVLQVMDGDLPERIDMVYSHPHMDHIGAAMRVYNFSRKNYPGARINVWGTSDVIGLFERPSSDAVYTAAKKKVVRPNIIVGKSGRRLSLAEGLSVEMKIIGGHSGRDLVLYIPRYQDEAAIAMHVDIVFPGWVPAPELAVTMNFGEYIRAQEELLKLDFDTVVSGHFAQGTRNDVIMNLQYSKDLQEAAAAARDNVHDLEVASKFKPFADPSAAEFGNVYNLLFGVIRKAKIGFCYRAMMEKWGCRLSGLTVVLRGHCFTAVTYLITDTGY